MAVSLNERKKTDGAVYCQRRGLCEPEVERSRREHGANVLSAKKAKSFLSKFISNLGDPIIKILIGALVVNVIFMWGRADWIETAGIAVSILLATFISTLSEHGSEKAFARLNDQCAKVCARVIRDGEIREIDIAEVVVGDLLLISAGDQIAADGDLIDGVVRVDQSSMTGESREIEKRAKTASDDVCELPSSEYFCLRGCTVISGPMFCQK